MPVTNNIIQVYVNSVDKTSSLVKDSIFVRLQQKNRSTAELKFINYDPPERATTIIYFNGVAIFGGYIVRKSASLKGVKGSSAVTWSCELKDWSDILETVKVTAQFTEQTDAYIVDNLLSGYFPAVFDSTSYVNQLSSSVSISFNDVSVTEALEQLAKTVGANWFIRPDKGFSWYDKNTGTAASFSISSTPNDTTSFGFLNNSLAYEVDSGTLVNQVKVIAGVTSDGTKVVESFSGDGTTKTFTLTEIPNSIAYVGWNDGVGTYTSYGSFVGYAPQDKLRSQGGNYQVVVDQTAKSISIEGSTGLAPASSTTIDVQYYKKTLVYSTFNDLTSQSLFGVYPISIEDKEFTSYTAAEALANSILEQNAYGKSSLKFDTTKYGLLPGQLVNVDISELDVMQGWVDNVLVEEDNDNLTLENGDFILLESYALGRTFIVQEVAIQPVITTSNQYMLVSSVTAGKYVADIVDSLAQVAELKSSASTTQPIPTRLSNISSDLGEIQVGRAVFTDGGTARFNWGTPNAATGVVLGLEDSTGLEGAFYIYSSGSATVKLGKMDGLPNIGTITPNGWGIYTTNGFFKGIVAASQLVGGTVTGSLITGNTISGGTVTGNYISGGTIDSGVFNGGTIFTSRLVGGTLSAMNIETNTLTGNTLTANNITSGTITGNVINGGTVTGSQIVGNTIIGGTIATGTPPINSANPGVLMDSTGLYGYGSAGLTFRLSSDPAIKPWFSSGTILNTVYEVNTSSVIRTGTTNPRVQIDNSGIFAYDSAGTLNFSVDSATGLLTANNGTFQGIVQSSLLSSNYISSGTIEGVLITGNQISAGTITGSRINGGTVSSGLFTGGTVTAGTIVGNLISGGTVTGNLVSGGTVQGSFISGGTVNGGVISGNTISGNTISGGTITGSSIQGGTVTAGSFVGGTVSSGTVTGSYISGGTITGAEVIAGSGSVTLNTQGIRLFPSTTSYNSSVEDASSVKWKSGTTTLTEIYVTNLSPGASHQVIVGKNASLGGTWNTIVYGTSSIYSEIRQYPTYITTFVDGAEALRIEKATLTTYGNVIPYNHNTNTVGTTNYGYKYIYLSSPSGTNYKVGVSDAGALTITAA